MDSGEESVWPAKLLQEIPTVIGEGGRKKFLVANCQEMGHYCANFRLRCDTIDDSGGSTQRHDDEDKCMRWQFMRSQNNHEQLRETENKACTCIDLYS